MELLAIVVFEEELIENGDQEIENIIKEAVCQQTVDSVKPENV